MIRYICANVCRTCMFSFVFDDNFPAQIAMSVTLKWIAMTMVSCFCPRGWIWKCRMGLPDSRADWGHLQALSMSKLPVSLLRSTNATWSCIPRTFQFPMIYLLYYVATHNNVQLKRTVKKYQITTIPFISPLWKLLTGRWLQIAFFSSGHTGIEFLPNYLIFG